MDLPVVMSCIKFANRVFGDGAAIERGIGKATLSRHVVGSVVPHSAGLGFSDDS